MFAGSMVALVTPFKEGKVDWQSLEDLVEFHIKNGTNGIVPCGTTGESATLDHKEHHEVIERVIKVVNKRVPSSPAPARIQLRKASRLQRERRRPAPTA